jgi:hypothetical protein
MVRNCEPEAPSEFGQSLSIYYLRSTNHHRAEIDGSEVKHPAGCSLVDGPLGPTDGPSRMREGPSVGRFPCAIHWREVRSCPEFDLRSSTPSVAMHQVFCLPNCLQLELPVSAQFPFPSALRGIRAEPCNWEAGLFRAITCRFTRTLVLADIEAPRQDVAVRSPSSLPDRQWFSRA